MILHHSAVPKPDPIPTPTPRTPSSAYARCDDCGADAGLPCVDENLRPCQLCPGRVLASEGAERREAQERAKRPPPKPRASRGVPRSTACANCGTGIRSDGHYCDSAPCRAARQRQPPRRCRGCQCEISPRRRWCEADACQREYRRQRDAADLLRRIAKPVPCCVCGEMVAGRSPSATRPICGAIDCKRRRQCELRQEHRSRVRDQKRSTKPPEQEQQQCT